jgi:DNA-binding PadR family transcriptional regulator
MAQNKPTNLEFALIGLLHNRPQSGYDLRKIFAETAMGNYSSSPGAIYPALKRLEAKGLIKGTVDSTKSLRPKKMFTPTKAGFEIFRDWLVQEITLEDLRRHQSELMLRFAFYSTLQDAKASNAFLKNLSDRVDEYLQELLAQRDVFDGMGQSPNEAAFHGRMTFEFGIEQVRGLGRWARKTMKHFEGD